MKRIGIGLCTLLLAIGAVACGDPGGGRVAEREIAALEAAADNAAGAGSSRITATMTAGVAGQELEIEIEGAFDFDDEIGEMTMVMTGAGLPSGSTFYAVFEGDYMYMKVPEDLPAAAPQGWVRFDITETQGTGLGTTPFSQKPTELLEFLRGASDDVEELGTEDVRGVSTTHYAATLSFEKILDQAPDQEAADRMRQQFDELGAEIDPIPSEIWIDDDGLPRRMTMTMSAGEGEQGFEIDVSMELFDYGVDVDVRPPKRFEELPA